MTGRIRGLGVQIPPGVPVRYNKLLGKVVDSIARIFQKRVAAGLQSGHDFVIPDKKQQASEADDFELVTWLVIK